MLKLEVRLWGKKGQRDQKWTFWNQRLWRGRKKIKLGKLSNSDSD